MIRAVGTAGALAALAESSPPPELTGLSGWVVDAAIPAGVERMPLWRFSLYTTLGSGVWNSIFIGLGYQLGARWTTIGEYSDWINAAVIGAIVAAVLYFVVKRVRTRLRRRTAQPVRR